MGNEKEGVGDTLRSERLARRLVTANAGSELIHSGSVALVRIEQSERRERCAYVIRVVPAEELPFVPAGEATPTVRAGVAARRGRRRSAEQAGREVALAAVGEDRHHERAVVVAVLEAAVGAERAHVG